MNKHFMIVGTAVLLLAISFSGCMEQTAILKEDDEPINVENKVPIIQECKVEYLDRLNSSTVNFAGYAWDIDGEIYSYHWSLSDGSTSDERFFTHTFSNSGIYYARLTVIDDDGATDSKTISITITASI